MLSISFYPKLMTNAPIPQIRLLPKRHRRVKMGHPWIYSNEVEMTSEAKSLTPGSVVNFKNASNDLFGTGFFNPKPLVVGRILSNEVNVPIDEQFILERLTQACTLRDRLFREPFYRLIHAEADGMPGVIMDRYDDTIVVQINSAGFNLLESEIQSALKRLLDPKTIIIQKSSAARSLEGLSLETDKVLGKVSEHTELMENGLVFITDLKNGQKTGWFYDQRGNRAAVAAIASGARVLDCYCYLGGFGINAAAAGAESVTMVDRSESALSLAEAAADRNGLGRICKFERDEAFTFLEKALSHGKRWDVVIVDPPAFVKSRKDLAAGLRGYRKLLRLAALLVEPGGFLFAASCSHNVDEKAFSEQVRHGLADAGRNGRLLRTGGAAPDHPIHPFLAESAYLCSELLQLD
jgi:23S rRNA (cytosine1962-C5)-methyltransferase